MMAPTHVAMSLALVLPVANAAPEFTPVATLGAVVGGVVPDLDLFVGQHRRTLHFPVLLWPVAGVAGAVALLAPSTASVAVAVGVFAAAVHAASDVLGAGEELRPWERTNRNAVYDHLRGRWLTARYVVRYDGAPEDLGATLVLAAPTALLLAGPPRWVAVAALAAGVPYAVVRKRLPKYFARLVDS